MLEPIDKCIVCQSPLGQDTKDCGFYTCLEHRACVICGHNLKAPELKWCYDQAQELGQELKLQHARCAIVSVDPTKDPTLTISQSHYDMLNLVRLMVDPNMDLSITTNENNAMIQSARYVHEMDFDKRFAHLRMLEACVAQVSLSIAQDKKSLKERADKREDVKKKKAQKEAETSSRPVTKTPEDNGEISLAEFMKNFGFKSRKLALQKQRDRDKACQAFQKMGLTATMSKQMADQALSEQITKGTVKLED